MTTNADVRSIHLTVRFDDAGSTFDVSADPELSTPRPNAYFYGDGIGPGDSERLRSLLNKIAAAYDVASNMAIEVDGKKILK